MSRRTILLSAAVAALAMTASAQAQVLYTENFDVDNSANWTVNASNAGNEANLFFDYSTVGIPSAPNSTGGSTRGLKMEANIPGTGVFSGVSASPNGLNLTGDYILSFDAWQNFNGPFPAGGSGSTQMTQAGIGTTGTTAQFPGGTYNGVGFAASGDGGTGTDYRIYTAAGAPVSPVTNPGTYAAGNDAAAQNNTHAYYSVFGNETAPAAQTALFPQQTGSTAVGTQGMAWHEWVITKTGDIVTWQVDGVLLATVDTATVQPTPTFAGGNIFFGQFDINATSSTDVNARSLLFGLIDNVQVVVPEPSSLALAGIGAMGLLRRRRR